MESKLFVGNLSYDVTEDQLRELFSQAGAVKDVMVIMDRGTGRSKGFGFVEMMTQVEAEKAIKLFNDHEVEGRRLVVNIARPREERPRSGGFGERGGGGRDRRGGGGRDRRGGGGRDRRY